MKTWHICSSVMQWFSTTCYRAAAAHNLGYIQMENRFSFSPALRRIILPVPDWVIGWFCFALVWSRRLSIFLSFTSNIFREPLFINAPFSVSYVTIVNGEIPAFLASPVLLVRSYSMNYLTVFCSKPILSFILLLYEGSIALFLLSFSDPLINEVLVKSPDIANPNWRDFAFFG